MQKSPEINNSPGTRSRWSVKPTDPDAGGRWIRMQSVNRFEAHNHALRTLVAAAYDLNPQAISGGPPCPSRASAALTVIVAEAIARRPDTQPANLPQLVARHIRRPYIWRLIPGLLLQLVVTDR